MLCAILIYNMFFVDKYAPKTYEQMFFHKDKLEELKMISAKDDLPHILVYGPPESGKKTLIQRFLELIYDKTINNLKTVDFNVVNSGTNNKSIIQLKQSNYHIIFDPNNNNSDKHTLRDVIKTYARVRPLEIYSVKKQFKVVLINNADMLSLSAQNALRRMMEIYSRTCKFVLWCTKISSIQDPIRSRCSLIRIPSPSNEQIYERLKFIAAKESIKISKSQYDEILKRSDGKIKKSIWLLQMHSMNITDSNTSYEKVIDQVIGLFFSRDIRSIPIIREILYNIMVTNITGKQIITDILNTLICGEKKLSDDQIMELIKIAEECEHPLSIMARRKIMHLERYVLKTFKVLNSDYIKDTPIKNKQRKNGVFNL